MFKNFKCKDKRTFIIYILATYVLLRLGFVIEGLCTSDFAQLSTVQNPYLSFVYAENTGGAFSAFKGMTVLLSCFGVIASLVAMFYVYSKLEFKDKFKIISCFVFSAGVLGNLIERIKYGYVIDFIKLNFVQFAVFNAFDIMITTSVIFYSVNVLFDEVLVGVRTKKWD